MERTRAITVELWEATMRTNTPPTELWDTILENYSSTTSVTFGGCTEISDITQGRLTPRRSSPYIS